MTCVAWPLAALVLIEVVVLDLAGAGLDFDLLEAASLADVVLR
jgi:hypothetical protein